MVPCEAPRARCYLAQQGKSEDAALGALLRSCDVDDLAKPSIEIDHTIHSLAHPPWIALAGFDKLLKQGVGAVGSLFGRDAGLLDEGHPVGDPLYRTANSHLQVLCSLLGVLSAIAIKEHHLVLDGGPEPQRCNVK